MKKILFSILLVFLLLSLVRPGSIAYANSAPPINILTAPQNKMDASLRAELNSLQAGDMITVIVTLRQQTDLSRVTGNNRNARRQALVRLLKATADGSQIRLKRLLDVRRGQGAVKSFTSFWVFDGFSITANSAVIDELAQHPDVFSISTDDLPIVPALGPAEPNVSVVNAPALWNLGDYGQGVVVANMDSGVDLNHPDLSTRWRGGGNSWFDPYAQHALPTDMSGHGTQTMGIMVGGDAGGTSIGVAPGAQWIAVKIFNDAGGSTATAIHLGFQWLLDPDGNPNTADAPDVVNNSWTYANPGCYLDFEPDLQSLRSAGILPVFAAGNGGPSGNTSFSPANNPSAFAVGAINNNSQIYGYSSRGPTTCGGSTGPFPELVAPGVFINTSDLYGFYTNAYSGTSYAAPHVAGGLALLLSAYPNLSAIDQQNALINSAFDLGIAGPDNVYGYGRLNLLAAFNLLGSAPTATPPSANTATPLPTFTTTSLPSNTVTSSPTFTSMPTNTAMPSLTFTPLPSSTATPLPTLTSAPTNTAMPSPTFTSTPLSTFTATATTVSVTTMHVGDLDRSSTRSGTKWNAIVTILVHNNLEQLVANATVTGKWTNGATGTVTCVTNSSGICTLTKTGLNTQTTSVTFSITNLTATSLSYRSTSNHDPDGESNGTVIVVAKP